MQNNYQISTMTREELNTAVSWAAQEGWNPGLDDANCFYQTDASGFFVGKLNGELIAVGSAVCYDAQFAFCGFYIVKPTHRGQGFGMALTKKRLEYAASRCVGIDGVLENVDIYQNIGYVEVDRNQRFLGREKPKLQDDKALVNLNDLPFKVLKDYDRQCFPAARDNFLRCWTHQAHHHAVAFYDSKSLQGYGVIRPAHQGFRIGPLFADSFSIAEAILAKLLSNIQDEPFFIDIPQSNLAGLKLAQKYNWEPCFATARMYRNGVPSIESNKIFGITSFELG